MLVAVATQAQNDSDEMTGNTASLPDGKVMLGTYYADRFVGRKTSCGEIFRQNQYTAAHKTIPMGTYLLVTYPVTEQQVVVRVNDRCPRAGILDMTKLAVYSIGIKGSGKVIVTVLDPDEGYEMWVNQDTLLMDAADYYAFRDKSRPRRISPYPISPTDKSPSSPRKKTPIKKQTAKQTPKEQHEPQDTLPSLDIVSTVPPEPSYMESPAHQGKLYDIELCVVNSQIAANYEAHRLPNDLQPKVKFKKNPMNQQVQVILELADTRSHAVRTQAMLIDDFPDSCLTLHE